MPETYIITPDYNGKRFLEEYFSSILNQTYNDFKIILVDNSPNNDSIDYINENYSKELDSAKIKIIKNPLNYGFAKANNQGIAEGLKDPECKYIICLNNDTAVERKFLEKLISSAHKHPEAGSIQPKMIWGQHPDLLDSAGLEYSRNGLGFNRGAYENTEKYDVEEEILGCCAGACLYKIKALEDVKIDGEYFDEDFFAYYEDFDLALRLRWAGWSSWYCPEAVVWHYKGGTKLPLSDFTVYHNWRNYTWTLFKNLPYSFLLWNFPLIFIAEISQIFLNLARGNYIILKAKKDAYTGLKMAIDKKKRIKRRYPFKEIEKFFILKWRP